MKKQNISNQIGEIKFRSHLANHQVNDKTFVDAQYSKSEIEKILNDRINVTINDFNILKRKFNIPEFFLELGSERCQRALALQNDFSFSGIAFDLSYDMLKTCRYYSKQFNRPNLPFRICADAYNLPFKSGSVPFVFCYEFLHHFPDPKPILDEIYRVLSNGCYFYFSEEPIKKNLHFPVITKAIPKFKNSMFNGFSRLINSIFLKEKIVESDYNIIENHSIKISYWKKATSKFSNRIFSISTVNGINFHLTSRNIIKHIFAYLFGGSISLISFKPGKALPFQGIDSIIICPQCRIENKETKLSLSDTFYHCKECSNNFPIRDGIAFLFSINKLNELYPDLV